ncbi:MAG: ATP synthase F1 subunit delta [Acidobacteria bacterium]|nr:ATP synthase F1 subunit delta [Acidobacteriota bacterium]MCA1642691.1 ATP synthase F1 subunit delta [Acidobacteriota bacterium]
MQTMARRYAAALAGVVMAGGEAREVQAELSAWESMMQGNPDLLEVFRNPTIPYEQKRGVLAALIARVRVRPTTANFLQVLLRNQRLPDLYEINKRFALELDERSGVVVAQVTTARPVPTSVQESLGDSLSNLTGRRVRLQFAVDDDLIGGVTTRIGSTVYDGSVRTKLQQIKQRMAGEI